LFARAVKKKTVDGQGKKRLATGEEASKERERERGMKEKERERLPCCTCRPKK
jgi:hypothetical protein